ncbi:pyruvate kinase [uncultured Eubacterium sp.]|uniref:pyruvate kinase n=1 Tax=uncultured Eubacterium sp. TaxID=165185 RepID=UPI002672CE64|nr:pyruvate kinase [uncultured Eubacterium sp.]
MRKTKIVCTLGPATDNDKVLEGLIRGGMNVARCNFSHGTHDDHKARIDKVKEMRKKCDQPVAILLDTKGPEIRTGLFKDGVIHVHAGQIFTLVGDREVEGNEKQVNITFDRLYKDVAPGTIILIDDGLVKLEVIRIEGTDIVCEIKNDGKISNRKGVNVPDIHINMEYMSEQDERDIIFGIEQDVDYIAASFVRTADDVKCIRKILDENGGQNINIIAKIENSEGIINIDSIIDEADAIMVARGDMGVELPEEEVPIIQKMIIKKVYEAGKQVITATQMLDSMVNNPRPTRAETTDVANAIYDGTSAIMLSGETAAGKYPVESVEMMARIAERTEMDINYKQRFFNMPRNGKVDVTQAVCHATCTTAYDLGAKSILTVTKSGRSARMISRFRPDCMITAGSTSEKVCRQLNMSWGVTPVLIKEKENVLELFDYAVEVAKEKGLVQKDDIVVITSGVPIGKSGTTNMMKVHMVE